MLELHPLPHFLMTRGLILTLALLCSAIVLLSIGQPYWIALYYARALQSNAALLLGRSLLGPLLLEDVLRRTL